MAMSADRLSNYSKTRAAASKRSTRPGAMSRSAIASRQAENKGVKDGTVRRGAKGKGYNVYDAASGTWRRGAVRAGNQPRRDGSEGPKKSMPSSSSQRPIYTRTTRFPRGNEVGPAALGVKAPRDGGRYVFGPPNDRRIYKYDKSSKGFKYVSKAARKK